MAYFNQRGFCRSKSDSARRCSVGAASNPSSSQRIALARKTKYAAVAHLVERHLAKVEVASSSLVTRSKVKRSTACTPFRIWYHSQVVRQGSAKPRFPSSNLGGTSIITKRYRYARQKARRINRFRAFLGPDFLVGKHRCQML